MKLVHALTRFPIDFVEGITAFCRRHPWMWWVLFGIVSVEWVVFVWMTL